MTNEFPNPDNNEVPNYYGGGMPPQQSTNNPYVNPVSDQPYYAQGGSQLPAPQPFSNPYVNQAPYQQPIPYGFAPAPAPTNKNALISLITSLATLFILCGIPVVGTIAAIVGIVFGHKALRETPNVPNSGRGMALTGTICGYAALAASLLVGALVILIILGAAVSGSSSY